MLTSLPRARAFLCCVLLAPGGLQATDFYVSTNGVPGGPGTLAQPYGLAWALSGGVGRPGDTFWLTDGSYAIGHIDTRIAGAPGLSITFRSVPGARARIDGSLNFFESPGWVTLRDLEFYSSDTNRLSSQTNAGFNPTDIKIIPGIASYAPNLRFINLIVHDETRHGFYISEASSNNLIYGCVVYNNGWRSPDNAEGHGIYVQGTNGGRVIADNLVFNNSGVDMHIYENTTNKYLARIVLDGNTAYNAGTLQNVRQYRDWVVGVDAPAISADAIRFENNMGFLGATPGEDDHVQIGRDGVNGSVAVLNNYLPEGLALNNWTQATVAGNVLGAEVSLLAVTLDQSQVSLTAIWNSNTYPVAASGPAFVDNANTLDFPGWQGATGFDSNSICSVDSLTNCRVFIRTNRYEAGRANLIVYNWGNLATVPVDVSSVLAPGSPYEVRNAADFFAPPVLSGVFDGLPLSLPMAGLTVAAPNAPLLTPAPTGPRFNVFVLLPRVVCLQAEAVQGQVQLSWPTNAGNWMPQFSPGLATDSTWTDVTNTPTLAGQQEVLAVPYAGSGGFFRLKAVPNPQ